MRKTIGIIGCGSMGSIVAKCLQEMNVSCYQDDGASGGQNRNPYNLWALVKHEEQKQKVEDLGFVPFFYGKDDHFKKEVDICILGVRPEQVCPLLSEWVQTVEDRTKPLLFLSLAAGVTLENMEKNFSDHIQDGKVQFARLMPNTLLSVGKGSIALCKGSHFTDSSTELVKSLFQSSGNIFEIEESKMNIFTALAGCTPALHYHILGSFIEAGVTMGLNRDTATKIAISLLQGCGECAEKLEKHPSLLREESTAPASMTSEGLYVFDRTGIRGIIIEAVRATAARGAAMDCENIKE